MSTSGDPAPLSLDSLNLLATLLAQVSISASQADFDEAAARVGRTRRELLAAIKAAEAIEVAAAKQDLDQPGPESQ
ncbi:MAG: hypothetical protein QOE07_1097 [Acidimicrobiaceae bacterium]|jgi:hypothetical protein|nr:hypothetical protein [Acidimicrobiaceae bacterium]MDQ1412509.1 hypothetical protein [Acidimicrobiaceae bacterium]MDQ1415220.1 hypothetical protein [Acidimicrobiaceae bacterium]